MVSLLLVRLARRIPGLAPDVPSELSIVEVGRMMGVPGWIM